MTRALVVSGGGAKGAFAAGAIEVLVEDFGLTFDIVTGTSTGALIAPFIAAGDYQRLGPLYLGMRTENFLDKRKNVALSLFFDDAIFDVAPFHQTLDQLVTAEMAARVFAPAAPRIVIATVGLQSGDLVYFHTFAEGAFRLTPGARGARILDRPHLLDVMEASSNQPVFMSPVKVKTAADQPADQIEQFVDGGVREYAPIRVAIENGATEVYAVLLSPPGHPRGQGRYNAAFSILQRTFDLFMDDVGETDVEEADLAARTRGARIQYIQPDAPLLTDSLEISAGLQGEMMEEGRRVATERGAL